MEITNNENTPNRKFLDISFWLAHIAFILGIMIAGTGGEAGKNTGNILLSMALGLLVVATISLFTYFFAIGDFAKKMGRNGLIWGGLTFIFSPIGVWVSYIASFNINPLPIKPPEPEVKKSSAQQFATIAFIIVGLGALIYVYFATQQV